MINVNQFKELCTDIVPAVGIKGYVMASTYEQGTKKLKDKAGLILVGVYPAYHFDGNVDASRTINEKINYLAPKKIVIVKDFRILILNHYRLIQNTIYLVVTLAIQSNLLVNFTLWESLKN